MKKFSTLINIIIKSLAIFSSFANIFTSSNYLNLPTSFLSKIKHPDIFKIILLVLFLLFILYNNI